MKNFIINIVVFLLGIIMLNILLYSAPPYYIYHKSYQRVNTTFKTYLLSDSHGARLSNYLEKYSIYNFSAGSDSYFDMSRKLRYLIRNTEVNTIILSIEDHTLSPYREKANNLDRSIYFSNISEFDSNYDFFKKVLLKKYIILINPKGRDLVKQYLMTLLFGSLKKQIVNDFSKLPIREQIQQSKNRVRSQFSFPFRSDKMYNELNEIIQICILNEIELIGIKFPLTKSFINEIEGKSYKADSAFYDNSLKVFDFKNLFMEYDNLFSDEDHLNDIGAKKFVNILADKVKNARNHK
jgi:hypothetical protein